jgi:hypothetical protein
MTFGSTFGRTFSPTFQPSSQAVAVASGGWWLSGGIDPANCVAAYQPKGAASLEASYTDLSGNSHTITPGATEPSWDTDEGWYEGNVLDTGVNGQTSNWTLVITISGIWISANLIYSSLTNPRFAMIVNSAPQYVFMCISDNQRLRTNNATSVRTLGLSGKYGYLNGTLVTTDNGGTISGTPTIKIGPATAGGTKRILAAAIYNRHLTADEHIALSTAMNAL